MPVLPLHLLLISCIHVTGTKGFAFVGANPCIRPPLLLPLLLTYSAPFNVSYFHSIICAIRLSSTVICGSNISRPHHSVIANAVKQSRRRRFRPIHPPPPKKSQKSQKSQKTLDIHIILSYIIHKQVFIANRLTIQTNIWKYNGR